MLRPCLCILLYIESIVNASGPLDVRSRAKLGVKIGAQRTPLTKDNTRAQIALHAAAILFVSCCVVVVVVSDAPPSAIVVGVNNAFAVGGCRFDVFAGFYFYLSSASSFSSAAFDAAAVVYGGASTPSSLTHRTAAQNPSIR